METYRLILTGKNDAYFNMAVDEAIMRLHPIIKKPTLRLYGWDPAAISIGCFQSLNDEVDIEKCKNENIDYIRRITGGGAVFHDDELTYSFIIDENKINKNILESYKKICSATIYGLKTLGINAEYAPINDILVKGKKISGNAQTRRRGVLLQHGTILMDTDVDKMFSLLKVPDEKMRDKVVRSVKKRVTSVLFHLGRAEFEEMTNAIKTGFERTFDVKFELGNLTNEENELAKKLISEKYFSDTWLNKK